MKHKQRDYARLLTTVPPTNKFVKGVLGLTKPTEIREATQKLMGVEMQLAQIMQRSTWDSPEYRDADYAGDERRAELMQQIYEELINIPRLSDDDSICLGKGGASPNSPLQ